MGEGLWGLERLLGPCSLGLDPEVISFMGGTGGYSPPLVLELSLGSQCQDLSQPWPSLPTAAPPPTPGKSSRQSTTRPGLQAGGPGPSWSSGVPQAHPDGHLSPAPGHTLAYRSRVASFPPLASVSPSVEKGVPNSSQLADLLESEGESLLIQQEP